MKCEYEGCGNPARPVRLTVGMGHDSIDPQVVLCDLHLASWLRAKADEVEGVKECPECHGARGWIRGDIIEGYEWFPCTNKCGSGKVPR